VWIVLGHIHASVIPDGMGFCVTLWSTHACQILVNITATAVVEENLGVEGICQLVTLSVTVLGTTLVGKILYCWRVLNLTIVQYQGFIAKVFLSHVLPIHARTVACAAL
jgi:hypothetical protein